MASSRGYNPLDAYIAKMDEGILICRARHRHNWPSDTVRPGRAMPDGIDTARRVDGSYQITEWCTDCGVECTWNTKPKGVFDPDSYRRYKYPEHWVVIPQDVDHTPSDLKAARLGMIHDVLFTPRRRNS